MWYGFDSKQFKKGLIVFFCIGVIAGLLGLFGTIYQGREIANWWALVALVIFVPGLWLFMSLMFFATWIKIEDEKEIGWYLYKYLLIKKISINDICKIRPGTFAAVVIESCGGSVFILGLDVRLRRQLAQHLINLNQNIT